MVLAVRGAAEKAWFRSIQELYCWGANPSLALQTEALHSWTSRKPARPPVCSFSMACCVMEPDRVRGGGDGTGLEVIWKSQPGDLPFLHLNHRWCVICAQLWNTLTSAAYWLTPHCACTWLITCGLVAFSLIMIITGIFFCVHCESSTFDLWLWSQQSGLSIND